MSKKHDKDTPSTLPPDQQPQGTHIGDLRQTLFATIKAVQGNTMRLEQAKMVSDLSQVIINSAKVEVEYIRATQGKAKGSGFMDKPAEQPAGAVAAEPTGLLENGAPSETQEAPAQPTMLEGVGLKAEALGSGVTRFRASDEERG